ncbi:MAG TPA: hypothetical protein VMD03_08090 [Steroidobacteraceae bacterium]|nr:hypothetical protein [Steroidobacteraceae bacterium]
MIDRKGKPSDSPTHSTGATSIIERRRVGKVVHDERGNARLEWADAPAENERTTLSLEDTQPAYKPEQGYDPYAKTARGQGRPYDPALQGRGQVRGQAKEPEPARPPKRDLRKLSEWIKQMRELEERRRRGED